MGLWTTYLSFLARNKDEINTKLREISKKHGIIVLYVMRNRGNNAVAPSKELLHLGKNGKITWKEYAERYLKELNNNEYAFAWMNELAFDSQTLEIVLVCFEKDAEHCHRTLLAKEIVRHFPFVDFRGELSQLMEASEK